MANILPKQVSIPEGIMFEMLGEEAVILNIGTGYYFGLDNIGTRIWQLLVETGQPEIVLIRLLDEYEVDESTLRADLSKLIQQLEEKKLITSTY